MIIVRAETEKLIQIVRGASKMKKLGRPRKSVRKENISVNLPSYLIKQISDKLSWSSSRSVWIQSAIEDKLGNGNSTYLQDATILQLLSVLRGRENVSKTLKFAINQEINIILAKQVAETVEPQ